jgi:hypothetical protein
MQLLFSSPLQPAMSQWRISDNSNEMVQGPCAHLGLHDKKD